MAVIELGLSKEAFLDLTPYELSILMDYNVKKAKNDAMVLRNTVYNVHANLNRKKGQKEIPLFPPDRKSIEEDEKKKERLRKERESLFGPFRAE